MSAAPKVDILVTLRPELAGYERIDLEVDQVRVGHVRCRFSIEKVIIYHIQVFPEFQGNGYGAAAIDMLKERFEYLVADRVRFTARGFWEKMGFVERPDFNWEWRRPASG